MAFCKKNLEKKISISLIFFTIFLIKLGNTSVAFNVYDSRYFQHGDRLYNERNGGLCTEFLRINSINHCCAERDDECYMIHYDTRCYCDNFCNRFETDCCPDAFENCHGYKTITTTASTTTTRATTTEAPDTSVCYKNGHYYRHNDEIKDNCNECTCSNGRWICNEDLCLVDVKLIDNINRNPESTWRASNYSKFWAKTQIDGYKHRLGTRVPSTKQRPFDPTLTYGTANIEIPSHYDYRNDPEIKNSFRRHAIKDQGECAASWAFSTIDVATDRLLKVSKGRHGNQSYSVQMLISCAILRNNADGCTPSTTDIAWNFINHITSNNGVVLESCYGYENENSETAKECKISKGEIEEGTDTCPTTGNNIAKGPASLLLASPVYPLKVSNENDIKREILMQGPVQAIFKVYPDFFVYKSGVYQWTGVEPDEEYAFDHHHSVKILGWGTENNQDYWLCANSWGEDWGENGYFKIKRGDCDIDKNIFAAWGHGKINGKLLYNLRAYQSRIQNMYSGN